MTHDDMERAIEFVLQQQARFFETQSGFQSHLNKLTDAALTLTGMVGKLAEAQIKTEERLIQMEERFDERFIALEQKLSQTDDRLNVLRDIVERHILGHNGKSHG